jgi:hypothetical protein
MGNPEMGKSSPKACLVAILLVLLVVGCCSLGRHPLLGMGEKRAGLQSVNGKLDDHLQFR